MLEMVKIRRNKQESEVVLSSRQDWAEKQRGWGTHPTF